MQTEESPTIWCKARETERIKTHKKNCENLQIGDPGRWRAMRRRVPGSESGVVHELMERVRMLGPQELLRDSLPCSSGC
jgi:hypothetical protein